MTKVQSRDMDKFREVFKQARNVLILTGEKNRFEVYNAVPFCLFTIAWTIWANLLHQVYFGAGVSAESGVPTFRGAGGLWRKFRAQDLASPYAFEENPSLVWEFYHYRRENMLTKKPNPAHIAITEAEHRLERDGKKLTIVTQNIDELHKKSGSNNIIELHGSLFKTKCTQCSEILCNTDSPICPSLKDKGEPNPNAEDARISVENLPRCTTCKGLLRPYVVWFGENLDSQVLESAYDAVGKCDICIVVGTSSVVYPAAMFAPQCAARGIPVAEFNIESTEATDTFQFFFQGKCGELLPTALAP